MADHSAAVQAAFEQHLGGPISGMKLGEAFKTMLEFKRDVSFDWADPDWDSLALEWERVRGEATRSGGFLGLFQSVTPGNITGYTCAVSRSVHERAGSDGDDPGGFVVLSLRFSYPASHDLEVAITASSDDEMLDSDDYETPEEFVTAVLETPIFTALALRDPEGVELLLESNA